MSTGPAPARTRPGLVLIGPVLLFMLLTAASYFVDARELVGESPVRLTVLIALGTLNLLALPLLLMGLRTGWILAISLAGWNLFFLLLRWALGEPNYIALVMAAAVAFLLNSSEMRAAYADRNASSS